MAGSYKHIVNDDGTFRGVSLLDHLGDAYETVEEMYGMVWYLAGRLADEVAANSVGSPDLAALVEEARQNYAAGIARSPGLRVREFDD